MSAKLKKPYVIEDIKWGEDGEMLPPTPLTRRALDPDMPAQELRLHMGELSAQEMRAARAAIRWANSVATGYLRSYENKDCTAMAEEAGMTFDSKWTFSYTPPPSGWFYSHNSSSVLCQSAKGGERTILDMRGWGYLTGRGHGALGLDSETAAKEQDGLAEFIIEACRRAASPGAEVVAWMHPHGAIWRADNCPDDIDFTKDGWIALHASGVPRPEHKSGLAHINDPITPAQEVGKPYVIEDIKWGDDGEMLPPTSGIEAGRDTLTEQYDRVCDIAMALLRQINPHTDLSEGTAQLFFSLHDQIKVHGPAALKTAMAQDVASGSHGSICRGEYGGQGSNLCTSKLEAGPASGSVDALADLKARLLACSVEFCENMPVGYGPPVNPDGKEAAGAIAALQQQLTDKDAPQVDRMQDAPVGGAGLRALIAELRREENDPEHPAHPERIAGWNAAVDQLEERLFETEDAAIELVNAQDVAVSSRGSACRGEYGEQGSSPCTGKLEPALTKDTVRVTPEFLVDELRSGKRMKPIAWTDESIFADGYCLIRGHSFIQRTPKTVGIAISPVTAGALDAIKEFGDVWTYVQSDQGAVGPMGGVAESAIPTRVEPVPAELMTRTFAVQHNPNCPSPWLVRLPGKSGVIDLKPYPALMVGEAETTADVLGFGKTFEDAARAALDASETPAHRDAWSIDEAKG